jgi:DNA-binding PadR family transcriptional regulator
LSHKFAVLGLLVERRGYGYELVQRLEERAGAALRVRQGAVYRALRDLERDKLARSAPHERDVAVESERANPRIMFEATDEGISVFQEWLTAPVKSDPFRHELALKIALSRPDDAPALLEVIEEYEIACLERLESESEPADAAPAAAESGWLTAAALTRELELRLLNAELEWVRDLRRAVAAAVASPRRLSRTEAEFNGGRPRSLTG